MKRSTRSLLTALVSPILSVALLAGVVAEARTRIQAGDAEPYHARVATAIERIPIDIGNWHGKDVPVPPSATRLLRPNVILSRQYVNLVKGWSAQLMVVSCRDARDLQGHYPLNCYPANGSKLTEEPLKRTWNVGGETIHGMEYHFSTPNGGGTVDQVVYNFFLIPYVAGTRMPAGTVGFCPDMTSVYRSGEDYQRRYYGASEVQLVTDNSNGAELTQQERDEVLNQILGPNMKNLMPLLNNPPAGGSASPSGTTSPGGNR